MGASWKAISCALIAVAAAGLAGCGMVDSRHPASDRADSVVDKGLFGVWQSVLDEETKDAPADAEPSEEVLAVGRLRPEEPTLLVTHVAVKTETGETKIEKSVALATKVGDRTYLSWRSHGEAFDGEDEVWVIVRYEMPDPDSLRVHFLDPERVAKEVEAGRIAGAVKRKPAEGLDPEKVAVRLSSPTADIRRFLAERADSLFYERVWKLRRVR
jgi:hypothetical protein